MDKYCEIFNHLLDNDGRKALQIVYDPELKEYHDNAHAYLRYNLTDINIDLNCLCGVNIENYNDFEIFKKMFNSWEEQYLKIPLHISIYSNKSIKNEILKISSNKLFLYHSDKKLSQFEHYKNILNNINNDKEKMWCMFSNYDDIWMKHRSIVFNILINLFNTCLFDKKPLYVKYNYVFENNANKDIVQYCCKYFNLLEFINNSHIKILNHKYCNLYFIKYISLNNGVCLGFPDGLLFKHIYINNNNKEYNDTDLFNMMILYFSKRNNFNIIDFGNFWNCFVKNVDFNLVKKNSIIMYNTNEELKIFQNSLLIKE